MAQSHVLSALIEKRREMAGQIDVRNKEIKAIKADMAAIDQAIKVFDPEFDIRTIKGKVIRKPNAYFARGESTALLLDVLREAKRPLTTTEIVDEAARRKGYSFESIDRRGFTASLFMVLKRLEGRGVIAQAGKCGATALWKLA